MMESRKKEYIRIRREKQELKRRPQASLHHMPQLRIRQSFNFTYLPLAGAKYASHERKSIQRSIYKETRNVIRKSEGCSGTLLELVHVRKPRTYE